MCAWYVGWGCVRLVRALPTAHIHIQHHRPQYTTRSQNQEGRLRQLESLVLLPDEIKFGEDGEEDGVEVADMVWVATDAFRCVGDSCM